MSSGASLDSEIAFNFEFHHPSRHASLCQLSYNVTMGVSSTTSNCAIQTALIDGPVETAALDWPVDCGAEAVFIGRTRGEEHGNENQPHDGKNVD